VGEKRVAIPCLNNDRYEKINITCGDIYFNTEHDRNETFYLYARYTGFNMTTFKNNFKGMYFYSAVFISL